MKESPFSLDYQEEEDSTSPKEVLFRYLRYWPWFLITVVLCVALGYAYMRYAPVIYESAAKIEIVDESKEINIAKDPMAVLTGSSSINMSNEIEVLKSYRILGQVVEALNLDISYYVKGNIKSTEIWNPPFAITKLMVEDSIGEPRTFDISLNAKEAYVSNSEGKGTTVVFNKQDSIPTGLPFNINIRDNVALEDYDGINFRVTLKPIKQAVIGLSRDLQVLPTDKNSEILSVSLKGQSIERSETILNELINKFNQDGVADRQLVSKRTLDFIDERFGFLSGELDSIEVDKEDFKRINNLSYIETDADFSLQRKTVTEDEVSELETQISLSGLLKNAVMDQSDYSLLPVNIGLENSGVNSLVSEYNEMAISRDKLITSVGTNHPTLITLSSQLERSKVNILKTINVYQTQLKLSLRQLNREKSQAGQSFARLPEKEKMLRSIERQQSIKENLFLLLLQKREEAALSYAVTAPSVKVVDYAFTNEEPLSPKKRIVYPVSALLGIMATFVFLFVRFSLDSKIRSQSDIEKLNPDIPVLGEIPFIKKGEKIMDVNSRSVTAESFRILGSNLNHYLSASGLGTGKVIYVTSAIQDEGKTLVSLNLSLAYASLKKRVLLVGADLRNPQLQDYFNADKKTSGLSDYLFEPELNWMDCIHDGIGKNAAHKVCFSGTIPASPPELLASNAFERFLDHARTEFDYIIVDTAPCFLVADTLLIAKYADLTLFIARAGFTDKSLLKFSKELDENNQLKNMAYVINDVEFKRSKRYGYGYGNQKASKVKGRPSY